MAMHSVFPKIVHVWKQHLIYVTADAQVYKNTDTFIMENI